jgi:hypothetical protein
VIFVVGETSTQLWISCKIMFVRRTTPVFLTGLMTVTLAISSSASVPSAHFTSSVRELPSQFESAPLSLEEFRRELAIPTLDPHPFSEEFYLRQFATETPAEPRRRSMLAPLSNAASGLSRKVASWRRALVRIMP